MAANEHDERRGHPDPVGLCGSLSLVGVDLDDLHAPGKLLRERAKVWLNLAAGSTGRREELDEHGAGVAKDLLLERGVVCVMEHGEILPRGQKALARPFLGVYSVVEASIMNALNRNVLPAPALAVALDGLGMGGRGSSLSSASSSSRRA